MKWRVSNFFPFANDPMLHQRLQPRSMGFSLTPTVGATRRVCHAVVILSILISLFTERANAQAGVPDSGQAIQVAPHRVLFSSRVKTASLTIRNPNDHPRAVQVLVEFAYVDEPHGVPYDTMIIATNMDVVDQHDTVISNPSPRDHYAGRWLSGLPTEFTLAPHESKHVTVRLTPPVSLPAGLYWARIVARVRPTDPRHGNNLDVQKKYALPTKGRVASLQDTCAVLYQTGELHMGLAVGPTAKAVIDSANIGGAGTQNFSHALWVRLPVKLTGNAPFMGQMHSTYTNLATGETVRPNTQEFNVFKDGVMHWVVETDVLAPGKYTLTFEFDNTLSDTTEALKIPMTPAKVTFPFEVKPAWAY